MAKKILLADDSLTIQKVVELTFTEEGYQVAVVGDGAQALQRIEEDPPDIVLADVVMPKKTGYEVCEQVKQNPATARIPVLLLVGKFEPFDEERARRVGASGQILKPFESSALVKRVAELLAASAPAAVAAAEPFAEAEEPVAAAFADPDPEEAAPPWMSGASASEDPVGESDTSQLHKRDDAGAGVGETAGGIFSSPAVDDPFSPAAGGDDLFAAPEATPAAFVAEAAFEPPPAGDSAFSPEEPVPPAEAAFAEPPPSFLADPVPAAEDPAAAIAGEVAPGEAEPSAGPEVSVDDFPEDLINAIVERVVRRMASDTVREVAWQVVPELAELMIKKKLEELQ